MVEAPEDQQVEVNVTDLAIASSINCASESLEIKDDPLGASGQSVLSCSQSRPALFTSVGRRVMITFSAGPRGPAVVRRGFSLSYRQASCNRTYTGSSGLILSPGWPNFYPHSVYCEMSVTGPSGTRLSLFFGNMQIENHPNCVYDYLEVYNTSTAVGTPLVRLCGAEIPSPIFLPSNAAFLRFVTDSSARYGGYDITYMASMQGCGGQLRSPIGAFTSPEYPSAPVAPRRACSYMILTQPQRRIRLTLSILPLGGGATPDCDYSYVAVYDGPGTAAMTRYCTSDTIAPITSSGNRLMLMYVSTNSTTVPSLAFRARYNTTTQIVGGGTS
jgi:hypothetical protein